MKSRDGNLWYIRYPFADDPSQSLIVATTRPETMLGDTALAVHPDDQRAIGALPARKIRLPITDRVVPLSMIPMLIRASGAACSKVTPGHDFNDFEIGERFGLDRISIFDADARIDGSAFSSRGEKGDWIDRYNLKDRFEARKLLAPNLKKKAFWKRSKPHRLAIGRCYRCQTVVEPYLTPQWFVNIKPLADRRWERCGKAGFELFLKAGPTPILHGWKISKIGAFRGRFGGVIRYRPGIVTPVMLRISIRSSEGEYLLPKTPTRWWLGRPPKICPAMRRSGIGPGSRRIGHLVFFCPLAVLNFRLARCDGGSQELSTRRLHWLPVSISLFLGSQNDHDGTQVHGGCAFSRCLYSRTGAR